MVRGDVTDPASVGAAMRGVDVAYYLVHALGSGKGFETADRRAARVFGERRGPRACGGSSTWARSSRPVCPRPSCRRI